MEQIFTGVIPDPRPLVQKVKDFNADELVTFGSVPDLWVEKQPKDFVKFPTRNQDGSLTCVMQTGAKMLGIENSLEEQNFIEFSAKDGYARRSNAPSSGMYGVDALEILSKYGLTTESRLKSQNIDETEINKPFIRTADDLSIAERYRAGGYAQISFDIDKIATIIKTQGKGVMLFFNFAYSEWIDIPELTSKNPNIYHAVTGVDVVLYKGQKSIVIEDSWGRFFGLDGQRIITEEFLKERLNFAGYILSLPNSHKPPKPFYHFTRSLKYGIISEDVVGLQNILKYEDLFPKNTHSTGFYGNVTARAVYQFQKKYNIAGLRELDILQGTIVGPKTIKKLNELYA